MSQAVIGGKYIVGQNPRRTDEQPCMSIWPGMTVIVKLDYNDGNVYADRLGPYPGDVVDFTCLMPAPE